MDVDDADDRGIPARSRMLRLGKGRVVVECAMGVQVDLPLRCVEKVDNGTSEEREVVVVEAVEEEIVVEEGRVVEAVEELVDS